PIAAIVRRALDAAWCAFLCALCACSDGAVATRSAQHTSPAAANPAAQDEGGKHPVPTQTVAAAAPDPAPFATAPRVRMAILERMTRHGEPLEIGSIELPEHWSVV